MTSSCSSEPSSVIIFESLVGLGAMVIILGHFDMVAGFENRCRLRWYRPNSGKDVDCYFDAGEATSWWSTVLEGQAA